MKFPAEHEIVEERLEREGAELLDGVEQRDVYFAAPHRDFASTDEALRVRRVDGEAMTTYKGAPGGDDVKARREIEVGVADAEAMEGVYEALGFEPVATVAKQRRRYRLGEITVCLDAVEDLGDWVELEATGDDGEANACRDRLQDVADRLGLDWTDGERRSYLEMLLAGDDREGNGETAEGDD